MADLHGFKRAGCSLTLAIALLPVLAGGVWAQGISGLSVTKNGGNSADTFEDGVLAGAQKKSIVGVQPGANATSFTVRYAHIVGADTGAFTSRTENFSANYTITFSVTAPGSYSLAVNTSRLGALTLVDDGTGNATATMGAVTGGQTGGSLTGALGLAGIPNLTGGNGNTPVNQASAATITGVSNGVPQVHTLTFSWAASCNSNGSGFSGLTGGDECAVRMGLPAEYGGETAGDYPGSGGRVQANDGHFVTVTFSSPCGNGVLEPGENEECDEGGSNGSAESCCNGDCSLKDAGTDCRAATGGCDAVEECDGVSGDCPADELEPFGTLCRAGSSGDLCDIDEFCDGLVADCPPDGVEAAGTVCRGAAGDCDTEEQCDGVSKLCPNDDVVAAGTTCRPAADICDVDEECDGVDVDCPADGFVAAGTSCRAPVDVCDAEEECTGSSAECPADAVEASDVVCRSATVGDACDLEETCDGVGTACPADEVAAAGVICRSATVGDVCDVEEECDGVSKQCPADEVEPAGTPCRAAAGDCDIAEDCDGTNKSCPADVVESAGTVCRASVGDCDIEEQCDGSNAECPADELESAGTVCRPAANECDVAEECDGNDANCPANAFENDGTPCTDDGEFCSGAETCQGGSCVSAGDPCGGGNCDESGDMCLVVGCAVGPINGCKTADKSILLYKNKNPDSRDKLIYKWIRGQSTSQGDFANPTTTAQYDLCIYSGDGLLLEANVPPSATKWKPLSSKGYKYSDSTFAEDGTQKIILKGHAANKAKLIWKGRSATLPDLTSLPIDMGDFPVVVQVVNSDNGQCFETTFDAGDVGKNESDQLRLKDQ